MGRVGSFVVGLLAIVWGAGSLASGPDVYAHPTSRGWGQPPMWIGPTPLWAEKALGAFLVLWGVAFIYVSLRGTKQPPGSH